MDTSFSSSASSSDSNVENLLDLTQPLAEFSQQMSNITQIFRNLGQLFAPEQMIDQTYGRKFLECLTSKSLTLSCGLLPQSAKPYNLPANLLSELKSLSTFSRAPCLHGCSLLLGLFDDYFHDLIKQCKKEKLAITFLMTEVDGTTSYKDLSYAAYAVQRNIQTIMGNAYRLIVSQGNYWYFPLKTKDLSENELEHYKKSMLDVLMTTEILINNILNWKNFSSWKNLLKAVCLFKKILTDHPNALFTPTELDPDMSQHFKRLRFRAGHFQELLENSTTSIKELSSGKQKEYQALFSSSKAFFDQSCMSLISIFTELSTNVDVSKLKKAYQLILKIHKESKKDQGSLLKHLANIASDNPLNQSHEMKMSNTLLFILFSIENVFQSLINEGLLTILMHLISINNLNEKTILPCLNNIFHCLQSIQHCEQAKRISEKISTFKQKQDVSQIDISFLTNIENLWTQDFVITSQDIFPVWIEILEKRKNYCNISNSTLDHALALRDILTFPAIILPAALTKTFEKLTILKPFIELNTFSEELRNIYESIKDTLDLYSQSINAIQQNVEDLLSTFFDQASQNVLEPVNSNKDIESKREQLLLALLEEENTALNRKKSKKTKNHRQKAELSITLSSKEKQNVSLTTSPTSLLASSSIEASKTPTSTASEVESPEQFELFSVQGNLEFSSPQKLIDQLLIIIPKIKALPLEDSADLSFRTHWKNASLSNLTGTLQQLQETIHTPQLNHNTVFGEINTIRRFIEHALGIVLTHYPLVNAEGFSLLQQQSNRTHLLHFYTQQIIHHSQGEVFPANIRQVVRALQATPYVLSYANACTNYLFTTAVQKNLPHQAKALVNYLFLVEKEIDHSHEELDIELLKKHQMIIQQGLFFVHELLQCIIEPQYSLEAYLSKKAPIQNTYFEMPEASQFPSTINESTRISSLPSVQESKVKTIHIQDRQQACIIIEEALIWIHIRLLSPVENTIEKSKRTEIRNQHLMNVELYLKWLKEKLLIPTLHCPYDLCLEALNLIRRAHKELTLGFLYHGAFYHQNIHVVDAENLHYLNNPCTLNHILRSHSSLASNIPDLTEFNWLGRIHQILSYPTALEDKPESFVDQSLRTLVKDVKKASKQNYLFSAQKEFKVVLGGGKTLTYHKHQERIEQLIKEEDRLKLFPALAALLQTLRYGISIPQSYLSQTEVTPKKRK